MMQYQTEEDARPWAATLSLHTVPYCETNYKILNVMNMPSTLSICLSANHIFV